MLDSDVENRETRRESVRNDDRCTEFSILSHRDSQTVISVSRVFLHVCDIAFVHSFAGLDHGVSSTVVPSKFKKEALWVFKR